MRRNHKIRHKKRKKLKTNRRLGRVNNTTGQKTWNIPQRRNKNMGNVHRIEIVGILASPNV